MFKAALQTVVGRNPVLTRGLRGVRPEISYSLEQRLSDFKTVDDETDARVNIGFDDKLTLKQRRADIAVRRQEWKQTKCDHKLQTLANTGQLKIDLDLEKSLWLEYLYSRHIAQAAEHYGLFRDLFDFGYFFPIVNLKVNFPLNADEATPVHRGNIILPSECSSVPEVSFNAEPGSLYTLVMTSLDAHLESADQEYLHWMVSNIPDGDVSKGQSICDYMRPFVSKGAGYHRFAFVLYKQESKMDLTSESRKPNTTSLPERSFRTFDFYRTHQDILTPCGLAFFQTKWDDSLMEFFHNVLNMKVPVFEYIPQEEVKKPFKKFPEGEAFNEYIDKYRDPKEVAEEIYCRRLKKLDPFKPEPAPLKYPHAHVIPKSVPSWLRTEMTKERNYEGKFAHMKKFSIYPEEEKKPFKGPEKVRVL